MLTGSLWSAGLLPHLDAREHELSRSSSESVMPYSKARPERRGPGKELREERQEEVRRCKPDAAQ